jgi:hypothetical protein
LFVVVCVWSLHQQSLNFISFSTPLRAALSQLRDLLMQWFFPFVDIAFEVLFPFETIGVIRGSLRLVLFRTVRTTPKYSATIGKH